MQSRGEALPLAKSAIRAKGSNSVNAGRKAYKLKMAKSLKLANSKTKTSKSKSKPRKAKPPRAANASHTRSQGRFPDPPVRLGRGSGLRVEQPVFGFHEGRFHCDRFEEPLPKGKRLKYAAVSLKESTLEGAGHGLFVRQRVAVGDAICEYGGEVVDLDEAKRRQTEEVI